MKKIDSPLITLGSPLGVGYEIFLRSFNESNIFKNKTVYCIGSELILKYFINLLKVNLNYISITIENIKEMNFSLINNKYNFILINIDKKDDNYTIDNIFEIENFIDGKIAYNTIFEAANLVKNNIFKSIVTLPVSKKNINLIDNNFSGHTEFFCSFWEQKKVFMCFISKKINILLLSTHIPIKKVSEFLTDELIEQAINTAIDLKKRLNFKKKICFVGLNPHAGENGLIGDEDLRFKEIIKKYSNDIDGPYPADTIFIKNNIKKYSIFICCYHDQGLIPFKMLSFDTGVNLSFGMDYIRTSVDHGTAIDLIGKNKANIKSFINAYLLAKRLTK